MDVLLNILFAFGILYLIVWAINAIIRSASHIPTWSGIIISAIFGMLPLYLILCFFGIMGEKRNESFIEMPSSTDTYAETMSRRYAYDSPLKKKSGWFKYVVLAFVVLFMIHLWTNDSTEQEIVTSTETTTSDNVLLDEQTEQAPSTIKKKAPAKKQGTNRKSSNPEMEKPLVRKKENLAIEHSIQQEMKISQEDNIDSKANKKQKSTLELLEEQNHASVVKQAKEAGVSTEGSTIDILERINHASVVKQAKEAGVSTEGSTIDILERINRRNLEREYK